MSSPVKVGLIGLSASASTSWAANAHFPFLKGSPDFVIKALCNTSKESARSAIKHFKLPDDTAAYGSPENIARDPSLDLIVCCTRVDTHYALIKPSIEQGKDVFVEWPLCHNTAKADELVTLARTTGSRIVVGLQGQQAPITQKVKELIDNGSIGKVLSCTVTAYGGSLYRDSMKESLAYFFDKKTGGNLITIGLMHLLHSVHHALQAEFKTLHSSLNFLRPEVPLKDSSGKVVRTITSDVPDEIVLQGILDNSVSLSVYYRRGQPFKDTPALDWRINGQKGELRVSGDSVAINAFDDSSKLQLEEHEKDYVQTVEYEDSMKNLPIPARNIGRLYKAYLAKDTTQYPDGQKALQRHQEIDLIWKST